MSLVIALLGLLIAGVIHLLIAPENAAQQSIHGVFFAELGLAQIVWALAVARHRRQHPTLTPRLFWIGIVLSGGTVVLWLLTQSIGSPFSDAVSAFGAPLLISKVGELAAFGTLLSTIPRRRRGAAPPARFTPSWFGGVSGALLAGGIVWGAGVLVQPIAYQMVPSLARTDHFQQIAAAQVGITTSAYFSIVNRGDADAIVSASAPNADAVTLHSTAIVDGIARTLSNVSIALTPHTRVDFAPAGNQLTITGLREDLLPGASLPVTLRMASGTEVTVAFQIESADPAQQRLNFTNSGDFQVSNAWAYATNSVEVLSTSGTPYTWHLPEGFPMPPVPGDNPMTEEKVALGRALFYDTRLSGNNTMSCSTCHLQSLAFSDGLAVSVGSTGVNHPRNASSLTNTAYNSTLTWANPTLLHLERQIPIPMFSEFPIELGITGSEDAVLDRFRADPAYAALFATAYPEASDPITFANITGALASFTRTLISGNSAYDQFTQGDPTAMSESAQRGMALFFSERFECHHCHTGFNFSLASTTANSTFQDRPFFNTGLYNLDGQGAYPAANTGIYEITGNAADMGRFRPPTLRNIALTAPYMHDGSVATLEEVIDIYANGGRLIESGALAGDGSANPYKSGLVPGFTITDEEAADLVAFLNSLTDLSFTTDPRFSDPFSQTAP